MRNGLESVEIHNLPETLTHSTYYSIMSLNERKIRNNTTGQMDTKVTGDCSHSDNLREELRKE
jgi:hypothetical protein